MNGTSTPWFPPGLGLDKYVGNTTTHSTVSYLVDDVSLKEIPIDQTWRQRANLRIDKLRKSDLTVRYSKTCLKQPLKNDHKIMFSRPILA